MGHRVDYGTVITTEFNCAVTLNAAWGLRGGSGVVARMAGEIPSGWELRPSQVTFIVTVIVFERPLKRRGAGGANVQAAWVALPIST